MFGSNFMSNQGEIGEESGSGGDGANVSRPPYDADGNAHLESVLLVIVSFFLLLLLFFLNFSNVDYPSVDQLARAVLSRE